MVLQYGDTERSFPKDSIFSCKTKSVWGAQEQVFVEMEFIVQVSTFC